MKNNIVRIFLFSLIIIMLSSLTISAAQYPAEIYVSGITQVDPGEDGFIMIDTKIEGGYNIQGVQIEFEYSPDFPEIKKTEVIANSTGWTNLGASEKNILGVGDVVENRASVIVKMTYSADPLAEPGTEYTFSISNVIVASADKEYDVRINPEELVIKIGGNKPVEGTVPDKEPEENIPAGGSTVKEEPPKEEKPQESPEEEETTVKNPFNDVKEQDWFFDSVMYVFQNGLMSGAGNGAFSPDATLTRGMLVTILHRLENSPEATPFKFSDVGRKEWYTKGVDWAASCGIVNGVGDGMFAPEAPITREQITVIFYNYAKYKGLDISARKDLSSYSDKDKISSWATTAFEWATQTGLVSGKSASILDPAGNATRAETSIIIKRFAENIAQK